MGSGFLADDGGVEELVEGVVFDDLGDVVQRDPDGAIREPVAGELGPFADEEGAAGEGALRDFVQVEGLLGRGAGDDGEVLALKRIGGEGGRGVRDEAGSAPGRGRAGGWPG